MYILIKIMETVIYYKIKMKPEAYLIKNYVQ